MDPGFEKNLPDSCTCVELVWAHVAYLGTCVLKEATIEGRLVPGVGERNFNISKYSSG